MLANILVTSLYRTHIPLMEPSRVETLGLIIQGRTLKLSLVVSLILVLSLFLWILFLQNFDPLPLGSFLPLNMPHHDNI